MLNPSGLDPTGARGFATQYGQQTANAGFSIGNLAGALQASGMQASQLGVRGGMAALQGGANTQQQVGQGRFSPQALQTNLQQLGNYQARQGAMTNAGLQNGMATAAGVRASLGALTMNNQGLIRPGVDRAGANLNLSNFGAGGNPGGLNMQGYQQNASLAAALGTQQAALNMQGIGRLAAAGMANNLQNARMGLGTNPATVNLMQQQGLGAPGNAAPGVNPSQDLLAMIGRQKQHVPAGFSAAQMGGLSGLTGQPNPLQAAFGAVGGQQGLAGQVGGMQVQDSEGPGPLDETNYPTLGGNSRQGAGGMGGADGFAGMGLRKAGAAGVGSEFSIQHEDFPALGAGQRGEDGRGAGYAGQQGGRGGYPLLGSMTQEQQMLAEQMLRGQPGGSEQYEQMLRYQQQQQQGRAAAAAAGAALKGALPGGPGVNAPDRYGLLGLMPLLKMADQDLTMLALGTDLTSLGLNLNSSESLHKSFVSPLAENAIKPEPEFELPACYRHSPQRLQPGYLSKFKEETLFYIFYSMPQDEGQLIAADELYTRGWFWHRRAKLWMISAPNTATQKTPRGERGSYLVFDPSVWEVVPKPDIDIVYDDLEPHPRLPRPKHLSGSQQQQQQQPQGAAAGRH